MTKKSGAKRKKTKKAQKAELNKLITKGKDKGFLTYDEINEALPDDLLSSDQIDETIMMFDELGIEIRIAHYPPYCSKSNPIEHRLFPHVTRACQGVIFKSREIVCELMAKTQTQQGLSVTLDVIDHVYETGRKVADDFKENMTIVFDQALPQWNYTAVPQST